MKSESEEFCKNSFDKFLRAKTPTSTLIWEEVERMAEPPEFYLSVNKIRYAVEVTILIQKVDVGAKNDLPVGIIRDLLRIFVIDEVETVARENDYLRGTYLVSFSKPITNFANVQKMIQVDLLDYISATQAESKAPPRVVFKHHRQECLIEKVHSDENKVVMGGPIIFKWENETLAEAKQLLDNRLNEKQHRLRNISHPKIVLLHNKYSFADFKDYKACILEVSSLHAFHTVFVVESNSAGHILYSQEPTWAQYS